MGNFQAVNKHINGLNDVSVMFKKELNNHFDNEKENGLKRSRVDEKLLFGHHRMTHKKEKETAQHMKNKRHFHAILHGIEKYKKNNMKEASVNKAKYKRKAGVNMIYSNCIGIVEAFEDAQVVDHARSILDDHSTKYTIDSECYIVTNEIQDDKNKRVNNKTKETKDTIIFEIGNTGKEDVLIQFCNHNKNKKK